MKKKKKKTVDFVFFVQLDLGKEPPRFDDPLITPFKPVKKQLGIYEDDTGLAVDIQTNKNILHNYCKHMRGYNHSLLNLQKTL
jgi:hypothetical protein